MAATTTTTLTSMSLSKSEPRDLCIICEEQPYDLICTCGDKFDFNCIHQHVEQLSFEFQDHYQNVSEKLTQINDLQQKENSNCDATRTIIDNWRRKRIQDINDIADKAQNDVQQRENIFQDTALFQEIYDALSSELHRIVHENLNKVIELHQQVKNKILDIENLPESIKDDSSLDALIQSKLHPSILNRNLSISSANINDQNSTISFSTFPTRLNTNILTPTESTNELTNIDNTNILTSTNNTNVLTNTDNTNVLASAEPTIELSNTYDRNTVTTKEPILRLTNTTNINDMANESTNNDEFDAGQTRHIKRTNPISISVNNDQFAGTVCCHNNQLIYNAYDQTTQSSLLTLIPDISVPTIKQNIDWNIPDTPISSDDDEKIQDIIYSNTLSGYLLLNRARLRLLKDNTHNLEEFYTFDHRTMKRLSCSDKFIYLTSAYNNITNNGDEIILMNYTKDEELHKTFRDIMPTRINRGAGPLVGEISDLAVGSNEQVTICYRLERRHEVGVCVFNVTNDGREWSLAKQLLLNDCWHHDLSYTPRIDWCEKLNVFILIEYMTGHLIMVDRDGQVEGECRFMQANNQRESPINLTISTNDWLCVRYDSSITIHKIIS